LLIFFFFFFGIDGNEIVHDVESDNKDNTCEYKLLDGDEFVEEPMRGMTFNSIEELILYYKKYAKKEGFGVVIKKATKNDSGHVIHITLACCRQGKPRTKISNTFSKPSTSTKTECKAKLNAKSVESKWFVTSVCIDHNHGLSPRNAKERIEHK
jgi:hypothetical protein